MYQYNKTSDKYYYNDVEITKNEYVTGIEDVKKAYEITRKIHKGENVEIPIDLQELVTKQIASLNVECEYEPTDEDYIECAKILLGVE